MEGEGVSDKPERFTRSETIWKKKFGYESETKPTREGTKLLGVEWSSINTPWERRMQTLAVALWVISFFLTGPVAFILFLLMFLSPIFFWIPLTYLLWYFWDRQTPFQGGRRCNYMRSLGICKRYVDYFPIRFIRTAPLDPSKNYLFASHPHGILCHGIFGSFATEAAGFKKKFPGLKSHLFGLPMFFKLPVLREFIMAWGVCPATPESMNYVLSKPGGGNMSVIVPGGAREIMDAHPGPECILLLKNRKGFVRIALQNGAPLVPMFSFGETEIFDQVSNAPGSVWRTVQTWFHEKIGFPPILLLGRGIFQYTFGPLPQRRPITVVVGSPIEFEKEPNPTKEQVDILHSRYIQELTELFEQYKGRYGQEDSYIKII